jgi:hypothetical protein
VRSYCGFRTLREISGVCLIVAAAGLLSAAEPSWSKRTDLPADLAGREMPPGMNAAWCFVPELEGFFLYGGYSPRINNEGWVFDPVKNTMRLLWPDDSLRYDAKTQSWRVLMPRDIHWSQDRPGAARGQAAVYSPDTRKVYLFGGHPGDRSWWGSTKLGTWELEPATLNFKPLGAGGPQGMVRGVYDRENRVVAAVVAGPYKPARTSVWLFSPAAGTWEEKTSSEAPVLGPCPGFAYDVKSKRCIYYSAYGETWAYDAGTNQWTNRKPATSPPPRRHAGMCFDENLGLTILHGGVRHDRGDHKNDPWTIYGSDHAFQFKREGYGIQFTDTWAYDFADNQWRELKPAAAPPLSASERDLLAYDGVHGACVLYDPAVGIWALGGTYKEGVADQPPAVLLEDRVLAAQQARAATPPPLIPAVSAWQDKLRTLPDDSWLAPELRKPDPGCSNIVYDPASRCLLIIGGHPPSFGTFEDYSYSNRIELLDMDSGQWFQRRPNHQWGPATDEYRQKRLCNGCGRAFCFDSKRKALWTVGGVASAHYGGTHGMQTYDVATDRFSVAAAGVTKWGSNSGLVYDSKNDLVVGVGGSGDERSASQTVIFDPRTQKWRNGEPHRAKPSQYTNVGYDSELGVILVTAFQGRPGMSTFVYDAAADRWRDLDPTDGDKVPTCDMPAIAYDSRNRAVLLVRHNYSEQGKSSDPLQMWILDLAANAWKPGAKGPPGQPFFGGAAYDANHNVFITGTKHNLLFYRYRGGCPKDAFAPREKN